MVLMHAHPWDIGAPTNMHASSSLSSGATAFRTHSIGPCKASDHNRLVFCSSDLNRFRSDIAIVWRPPRSDLVNRYRNDNMLSRRRRCSFGVRARDRSPFEGVVLVCSFAFRQCDCLSQATKRFATRQNQPAICIAIAHIIYGTLQSQRS